MSIQLPPGFKWETPPADEAPKAQARPALPDGFKWESAAPSIAEPPSFTGAMAKGFKRSLPETKSLLAGAGAAAAGAVGLDGVRDKLLDTYQGIQQTEVAPLQAKTGFIDAVTGDGSLKEWAGDTLGNFGGQAVQSLAAAGAGALVGSAVPGAGTVAGGVGGLLFKAGAKEMVTDAVGRMVAKGVAKDVAEKTALRRLGGAAIAGTGLNVGQEVGIGFTGRAEDAAAAGEQLNQQDALRAIGYGIPAGLVDTAAEALTGSRLMQGVSDSPKMLRRMAKGAGIGAVSEGATEGVQAVLERAGAARGLTGEEAYRDYIENAAAGALGGGVAGAGGGFRRQQDPAAPPPPETPPPMTPEVNASQALPPASSPLATPPAGPLTRAAATVPGAAPLATPPADVTGATAQTPSAAVDPPLVADTAAQVPQPASEQQDRNGPAPSAPTADPIFEQAKQLIGAAGKVQRGKLAEKLGLNRNQTQTLLDQLQAAGIVGPANGNKARKLLVNPLTGDVVDPDEKARLDRKVERDAQQRALEEAARGGKPAAAIEAAAAAQGQQPEPTALSRPPMTPEYEAKMRERQTAALTRAQRPDPAAGATSAAAAVAFDTGAAAIAEQQAAQAAQDQQAQAAVSAQAEADKAQQQQQKLAEKAAKEADKAARQAEKDRVQAEKTAQAEALKTTDEDIQVAVQADIEAGKPMDSMRMSALAKKLGVTPRRVDQMRVALAQKRKATAAKASASPDLAAAPSPETAARSPDLQTPAISAQTPSAGSVAEVAAPESPAPSGDSAYDTSADVLDDDITPPSGGAFSYRTAAESTAKRTPGGRVFEVDGGFVVRVPKAVVSQTETTAPTIVPTSGERLAAKAAERDAKPVLGNISVDTLTKAEEAVWEQVRTTPERATITLGELKRRAAQAATVRESLTVGTVAAENEQQERERADNEQQVAMPELSAHLESGQLPTINSEMADGKTVWTATAVKSTDKKHYLRLDPTKEERKAATVAESDIALADTQEEREAAKLALRQALLPATKRAVERAKAARAALTQAQPAAQETTNAKQEAPRTEQAAAEAKPEALLSEKPSGTMARQRMPRADAVAEVQRQLKVTKKRATEIVNEIRSEAKNLDGVTYNLKPGIVQTADVQAAIERERAAKRTEAKPAGFDSERFDKARKETIDASREAGNKHLDTVPASVETMRAYTIYDVHNPSNRGVVDTVDNNGNVYVLWENGTESSLGRSDMKDYAFTRDARLDAGALKKLRKAVETRQNSAQAAKTEANRKQAVDAVDRMQSTARELRPLIDKAMAGTAEQKDAAEAYLDGQIDEAELRAVMAADTPSGAVATHKDPGQPAEPVTAPVITEAIKTSASKTPLNLKEARAWLLERVDEALKGAPKSGANVTVSDPRTEDGRKVRDVSTDVVDPVSGASRPRLRVVEIKVADSGNSYNIMHGNKVLDRQDGSLRFAILTAENLLLASKWQPTGGPAGSWDFTGSAPADFVTFDVPGDGKFKVLNTRENLEAFRAKVVASSGFKDERKRTAAAPMAKSEAWTVINSFLEDAEFGNAYTYSNAVDKPLRYALDSRPAGATEDGVVAYAVADDVEIAGFKMWVGRMVTAVQKTRGTWSVVEPKTGRVLASGNTRDAAIGMARALAKKHGDKWVADKIKSEASNRTEAQREQDWLKANAPDVYALVNGEEEQEAAPVAKAAKPQQQAAQPAPAQPQDENAKPAKANDVDARYEHLLSLKSTRLMDKHSDGRALYEVTLSMEQRKALQDSRGQFIRSVSFEIKSKEDVTGKRYDAGYVLIDRREQNANRAALEAKARPVDKKAITAEDVASAVSAANYNHKGISFSVAAKHAEQVSAKLKKAGVPGWAVDMAIQAGKDQAARLRPGDAAKVAAAPIIESLRKNGFIKAEPVQTTSPTLAEAKKNEPLTEWALQGFIKIAADSVQTLRPVDVERVIRETPAQHRQAVAEYIKKNSYGALDLEVDDVARELGVTMTPVAPDLKGFKLEQTDSAAFDLVDGNMRVSVVPMADGKFQASYRGAKSSPHLQSKQAAIDWAAGYRDEAKRLAAPASSVQGQKNMAARGGRIATLMAMNGRLRKLDPDSAWLDSNIEQADDLDALQDQISEALTKAERGKQPTNALRSELEQMSGAELRVVFDRMSLAGARMTHIERVEALMAEDEAAVRAAMAAVQPEATTGPADAKGERKFYVTMIRDSKVARIAGPFDTKEEADAILPAARDKAKEVDPRAVFDAFGVSAVTMEEHKPAALNEQLGIGKKAPSSKPAAADNLPTKFISSYQGDADYSVYIRRIGKDVRVGYDKDGNFKNILSEITEDEKASARASVERFVREEAAKEIKFLEERGIDIPAELRAKAGQVEAAAAPTIPEGYKPTGEPYYVGKDLVQGYAKFPQGERVKLASGIQGVVTGHIGKGPILTRAMVKFDNGTESGVDERELVAVAAAKQDDDAPTMTRPEARELMFWQDMGQKDGEKSHRLTFYTSKDDAESKRGSMTYGKITKDQGSSKWFVEDGDSFTSLADAKRQATEMALDRAEREGFIAKDAPAKQEAQAKATATPPQAADFPDAASYHAAVAAYRAANPATPAAPKQDRRAEIKRELAALQQSYEKRMNRADGAVPPAIKADALAGIARKMDKLTAELKALDEAKATPAKPGAITDFGEKLPPARRAMAAKLDEALTDADIANRPLSEIWPIAENEAIEDTFAAAVAHAARAEIPAKPRKGYKVTQWVAKVKIMRDLAASLVSGRTDRDTFISAANKRAATVPSLAGYDLRDWISKVLLLEQIDRSQWKRISEVESRPDMKVKRGDAWVSAPQLRIVIDDKPHYLNGDNGAAEPATVAGNMAGILGLMAKDAQSKALRFEIRGSGGRFYIAKKDDPEIRQLMTFTSVEDARKAITEQYDSLVAAWQAIKDRDNITERDLRGEENRPRVGKDHRKGRDVKPEDFQEKFGFKGGEFGKWVQQGKGDKDRQTFLNNAYDSLMDLAELAGLKRAEQQLRNLEKDIQLNPVPPPAWLRNGAAIDTEVRWNGTAFVVTGHRWNGAGWFVIAQDAKGGEVVIPYLDAKDAQGMPLYEQREFKAPIVHAKKDEAPKDGTGPTLETVVQTNVSNAEPAPPGQPAAGIESTPARTVVGSRPYFRNFGGDVVHEPNAKKIELSEMPDGEFYIAPGLARDSGQFEIMEATTGLRVGLGKTRKAAIEAANKAIVENRATIKTALEQRAFPKDKLDAAIAKLDGGNRASFAKADKPNAPGARGMPEKNLTRLLATAKQAMALLGVNIEVVANGSDLPAEITAQDDYDDTVQAAITGDRKTVYFVASRIASPRAAIKLVAHELVGHMSMEQLLGKRWPELRDAILRLRDNGKWPEVFAEVSKRYERNADGTFRPLDDATFAAEAIAVFAERNIQTSILQRAVNSVRAWLRRLGFAMDMSQGELRQMLWEAGQKLEGRAYRAAVVDDVLGAKVEPKQMSMREAVQRYSFGKDDETPELKAQFDATARAYGGEQAWQRAKDSGRTKLNYVQWVQVRTPAFKAWFGDWEATAHRAFLDGAPVSELTGDEFKPDGVPLTTKVPEWYAKQKVASVEVDGIGAVALDVQAVKNSMSHGIGRDKVAAFAAVPDVLRLGKIVHREQMRGSNVGMVYHVAAPISIGGQEFVADVLVKADENTRRMYVHEVAVKEKLQQSVFKTGAVAAEAGKLAGTDAGAIRSVLQGIYAVNPDTVSKVIDQTTGEPLAANFAKAQPAPDDKAAFAKAGTLVDRLGTQMNPHGDPSVLDWIKNRLSAMRPAALGALTLRMLGEVAEKILPSVARYSGVVQLMDTMRKELQELGQDVVKASMDYQAKNSAEAREMFSMLHDATLEGVDPSQRQVAEMPDGTLKFIDDATPKQIEKLKDAGATIKRGQFHEPLMMVSEDYKTNVPVTEASVKAFIKVMRKQMKLNPGSAVAYMNREKEARKLRAQERKRIKSHMDMVPRFNALSDDGKKLWGQMRDAYRTQSNKYLEALLSRIDSLNLDKSKKAEQIARMRMKFESSRVPFYVPLARWGNYWVSGTNDKGKREFYMQESPTAQDEVIRDLTARGFTKIGKGVKLDTVRAQDGASATFMADIDDMLVKSGAPDKIRDEAFQLYLAALPDLSMRKAFIHRKGTRGYSEDAPRALAAHIFHGSFQIARLRYSHELEALRVEAEKESKAMSDEAHEEAVAAGHIVNELKKRHEWVMNPQDNALLNKISSLGFVYYLGLTPASALVNLLATPMVALPILAATGNWASASKHLWRAFKESAGSYGHMEKVLTNEDEIAAHKEFERRGVLDRSQVHNLAGIAESDSFAYSPKWHKTMTIISHMFHKAEVVNREATTMASYRMQREAGIGHEEAMNLAEQQTYEAHLDYSNANRARFMQSGTAKVLLMFRQYSLGMTWLIGRNLWKSDLLGGALGGKTDKAELREARRKVAGILGMTAIFSGTLGLPIIGTVGAVLNAVAAAFGDDDEPWDWETEFRAFLREMLGETGAEAVLRGPVQAATGVGISNRVSMGDLWFREPDRELEGRAWSNYLFEQAAGPMGGLITNFFRGQQLMGEGQVWRGVETMMPKAIKDAMKSLRYLDEGVNNLRGDAIVEDLNVFESLAQIAGFAPASVANAYDTARDVKNYEQAILSRRSRLMDAFALAWRLGDVDAREAVLVKMRKFSQTYPELAITGDSIRRSLMQRAKASTQAEHGVIIDKRIRARLEGQLGMG